MKAMRYTLAVAIAAFALGTTSVARAGGTTTATNPTNPTNPGTTQPPLDPTLDLPIDKPALATPPGPPPSPPPTNPTPNNPPPTIYGHDITSQNNTIFYVIDTSGSMSWDDEAYTTPDGKSAYGCRLDRAKSELIKSVMSLPANFKFNMLNYGCDISVWQSGMVPADDPHKQQAVAWTMALQADDATGTGPAVSTALGDKDNKLVVLLTDGAPNCGAGDGWGDPPCMEAHRQMIDSNNTQKAIINVFGIGATGDFKQFCMNVASDNGGTYTDVP